MFLGTVEQLLELVRQGIISLLADLVDTAIDRHSGTDGHSINATSRLDCAMSCRNFAEAWDIGFGKIKESRMNNPKSAASYDEDEEDLLARMESDGLVRRVLYRVMEGQMGNLLICRYFAQTMC